MAIDTPNAQGAQHAHTITVRVNNDAVTFHQQDATGLEIKETAIAQGVRIELDFPLFEVRHGHPLRQITDGETVELHNLEAFRAVPDDDNS